MYKHNNKTTTYTTKKFEGIKRIFSFLSIVSILSTILVVYTSWNNVYASLSMDTFIQTSLENLRPQDVIEDLYGNTKIWKNGPEADASVFKNMYSKAHKLASVQEEAAILQTYAALKADIQKTYSTGNYTCKINDQQVKALFENGGQTVSASACIPFTNCRKGIETTTRNTYKNRQNLWDNGVGGKDTITVTEFSECKSFVTTKYEQTYKKIKDTTTLINATIGTDIYANGTTDDWWFDILYDIEKLGDILFTNNEQTRKTLFFSFPQGSIAWLQAIPFWDNTTSSIIPDKIQLAWGNTQWGGWVSRDNTTRNGDGTTRTDRATRDSETPVRTEQGWELPTQNTQEWWQSNNSQTTDPAVNIPENTIISNYVCLPTNTSSEIDNLDKDSNSRWDETTDDKTDRPTRPTVDINDPWTSKPPASDNALTSSDSNWMNSNSFINNEDQVLKCIKKCTDSTMKATDKAFCIAKCSCTTMRTDDGMAWVSICMVPTRQTDVLSRKPIQSVQEVVDEINNVLTALRNSWEMIKHNRTTEFLDTSLSKVKLHKILAFDINLATKPIFTAASAPGKKENKTKSETETDKINNGTYTSIDIWAEKNKYIYYRNSIAEWKTISSTSRDNSSSVLPEVMTNSLSKTQNAEVIDQVSAFVMDNISFWDSLSDTLLSIQQTSDQIRQKIGKK